MAKRFTPILILTALCWLVFVVNNLILHGQLSQYGIVPRYLPGLRGLLTAPFLHASFAHIAANTLPLVILGAIICARNPGHFVTVTLCGMILGGGLTWLFARNAVHIGASGLIFCYFGFLASQAWFHRTFGTLALSLICIIAYGGMLRGVFPTMPGVSWESHLTGLLSGVFAAGLLAKPQKVKLVSRSQRASSAR